MSLPGNHLEIYIKARLFIVYEIFLEEKISGVFL